MVVGAKSELAHEQIRILSINEFHFSHVAVVYECIYFNFTNPRVELHFRCICYTTGWSEVKHHEIHIQMEDVMVFYVSIEA
jgi:hypothetical protein